MCKKPFLLLGLTLLLFTFPNLAVAYETLQGPTEVLFWDNQLAYNGYTLFGSDDKSYLIDMKGNIINSWNNGKNPKLLDNGNILVGTGDKEKGLVTGFDELDWHGNVVWSYSEARENYFPHHDWERIYNKKLNQYTTLYVANRSFSYEEALALGYDSTNPPFDKASVDVVTEVNMRGEVVWEWRFIDHLVQDMDPTKKNYVGEGKVIADYPEKLNINLLGRPLHEDWLHVNSIDYNDKLDQIAINAAAGEFYVIDHGGTFIDSDFEANLALTASEQGDFLYRFGDPARYNQGEPPSILTNWTNSTTGTKQIGPSHDIQWIKPGLPGEGNFLVFNNGNFLFEKTNNSYIFEINPYLGDGKSISDGYVNPPDSGYHALEPNNKGVVQKEPKQISNQVVWTYSSKSNQGFFSHIISGAQRLPNGNTLVTSGVDGHIFEITASGELAWEYVNPRTKDGNNSEIMQDNFPATNGVFTSFRYAVDATPFREKDLSPKGTLTGKPYIAKDSNEKPTSLIYISVISFGVGVALSATGFYLFTRKSKRKLIIS